MQNFFEKKEINSSNPFASQTKVQNVSSAANNGKRLNIVDMEVINSSNNANIEYMEIRMNNLYRIIHQNPQNIDPVSLEEMKIEWEELRDKVTKAKKAKKTPIQRSKQTAGQMLKTFGRGFNRAITLIKMNNPQIKSIMNTFNEINREVEELVKKATPMGEEEIKYGLLVNRLYQAAKLNGKISSEIK